MSTSVAHGSHCNHCGAVLGSAGAWPLSPRAVSGPGEVPNKVASAVGGIEEKLPGREVVASREDMSQCKE